MACVTLCPGLTSQLFQARQQSPQAAGGGSSSSNPPVKRAHLQDDAAPVAPSKRMRTRQGAGGAGTSSHAVEQEGEVNKQEGEVNQQEVQHEEVQQVVRQGAASVQAPPFDHEKLMGFGKHKDLTYNVVYEEDSNYVDWCLGRPDPNVRMKKFLDYVVQRRRDEPREGHTALEMEQFEGLEYEPTEEEMMRDMRGACDACGAEDCEACQLREEIEDEARAYGDVQLEDLEW
ncbi:hypothetical protein FOA52_013216 [Chlamydomonas sp. UWO 241]|nr:hypothetical protein FOA52_013216 [Chlamydomonas sp. UWO 241]